MEKKHPAEDSPLGKTNVYITRYQPKLLYAIARAEKWQELGITADKLPFHGVDIWNGYELSWLNTKGKPIVAIAEFIIPADSPCIIESKSFKLYLNSFNQTIFPSKEAVKEALQQDLSLATKSHVIVTLNSLASMVEAGVHKTEGLCIDELDITIDQYDQPSIALLVAKPTPFICQETLYSQLLKSNCPVTGQPDWATVVINYQADKAIDHASLLRYIVSFRQHADFHEQCVERIFMDLNKLLAPTELTVYARYVRRGGLDINPYRSLTATKYFPNNRLARQ